MTRTDPGDSSAVDGRWLDLEIDEAVHLIGNNHHRVAILGTRIEIQFAMLHDLAAAAVVSILVVESGLDRDCIALREEIRMPFDLWAFVGPSMDSEALLRADIRMAYRLSWQPPVESRQQTQDPSTRQHTARRWQSFAACPSFVGSGTRPERTQRENAGLGMWKT